MFYFIIIVVVQEEGLRKVLVYLNIPELRVKRSFPNVIKKNSIKWESNNT